MLENCMTGYDESVCDSSRSLLLLNQSTNLPPLLVPELRIYRFFDRPLGPHPVAMFEVNLLSPAQFGAFIPWLTIWRGPLSVLVHPNTEEEGVEVWAREHRNHTQRATWMGEKIPIDASVFFRMRDVLQKRGS